MSFDRVVYVDMDDVICDYSGAHRAACSIDPDNRFPQSVPGFFLNLAPIPRGDRGCQHAARTVRRARPRRPLDPQPALPNRETAVDRNPIRLRLHEAADHLAGQGSADMTLSADGCGRIVSDERAVTYTPECRDD